MTKIFSQIIVSVAVKLGSFDLQNLLNWWNIIEFDSIFDERNIYVLLFNLRHVSSTCCAVEAILVI